MWFSSIRFIKTVACALFCLLLSSPSLAQRRSAVGVVISSLQAYAGAFPISEGSTIYSGEYVRTDKEGSLQMRVGSAQFSVGPLSSVRIFVFDQRTVLFLRGGSLLYSAGNLRESVTIYAGAAQFTPVASEPAVGQVEIKPPCAISARVSKGSLEITLGKQTQLVHAGEEYLVASSFGLISAASSQAQATGQQPGGTEPQSDEARGQVSCADDSSTTHRSGKSSFKKAGVAVGIAVGAGVAASVLVNRPVESPDHP